MSKSKYSSEFKTANSMLHSTMPVIWMERFISYVMDSNTEVPPVKSAILSLSLHGMIQPEFSMRKIKQSATGNDIPALAFELEIHRQFYQYMKNRKFLN